MYEVYVVFSDPIDDWCKAKSVSFAMSTKAFATGPARTAQTRDVVFTKLSDALTPAIFRYSLSGRVFKNVWVEFYRDDDEDPYLTRTLNDVVISSVNSGKGTESISLSVGR